ncbi:hypothetical protein COF77_29990 [Bacillus wiedmannii]|nr:hypothetical protein COF77_29990 [Bacillus wiedmannii]
MKSFEHKDEKLRHWRLGFVASSTNIDIGALSMSRDNAIQVFFRRWDYFDCIDMSFVALTPLLVFIVYKIK